ncbi:MAG: TonB-dependent receptor [Pseudomonadales bacterium]|nr:TonB-dependent receptor [Pseudomonadales bacterium]
MIKRTLPTAIAIAMSSALTLAQDTGQDSASVPASSAARPIPQVEEISVIGRYVPDEKRSTSALSSVLTNEQFSRSGDSNIAEGLKRVAGLSLVGGKFIFVRGMGDRYSSALLNGSSLPSPEPLNRVVPLDLFPNAVMDSVVVQKTYSAQFPSEFGGGVLQMRTKKSNDEFFFNVSTSLGSNDQTSFTNGLEANSGDKDWIGFDDGSRELPSLLAAATANGQQLKRKNPFLNDGGFTAQELQAIGQSLDNTYDVSSKSIPTDVGFSASLGNFHDVGNYRVNYMAALDYDNSWDQKDIERNTFKVAGQNELVSENEFDYSGTENNIDLTGFLTGSIELTDNHTLTATSLVLRQTDNIAAQSEGFFGDDRVNSRITEIDFIERELVSNQLQGEHYFPDAREFTLNWRYNRSTAERDSPDEREFRQDLVDDEYIFNLRSSSNVRRFSELDDLNKDYAIDASFVAYGPRGSTFTFSAGYNRQDNERDYEIRRFSFVELGDVANRPGFLSQPLSAILAPENIGPGGFELRETTRPTDAYHATRELEAYYLQTDINFSDRFQLLAGLRQEDYTQNVTTFDLFRPANTIKANLASDDLLPSMTATYILGNHQFRLGYSETTSRPDFRELSPATFTNPLTGLEVVGNPDLKIANIKNYDLRWEWYFGFSDSLSIGFFYKEFDSPIESVVQPGANSARSFINADSATNRGIEIDGRKQLDFLGDRWDGFYVAGNVSFIDSDVTIGQQANSILTNTSRSLQGQSDTLFNAQLGYDSFDGLTATLLYNFTGERIFEVGILGAPDLIEEERGELDVVIQKEFGSRWKMSLKAQNLLDERSDITQGGFITTGYKEGRSFSAQLEFRL